jgi:hypothetical protein
MTSTAYLRVFTGHTEEHQGVGARCCWNPHILPAAVECSGGIDEPVANPSQPTYLAVTAHPSNKLDRSRETPVTAVGAHEYRSFGWVAA